MRTQRPWMRLRSLLARAARRTLPTFRPTVMPLEDRLVPSHLVWVNRGQPSDRFSEVFGARADLARSVVDASLRHWERALVNLNQPASAPGDRNTINFTIAMDATGNDFGSSAEVVRNAFLDPEDETRNGYPIEGSVLLGRGKDSVGGPLGNGTGWFLDPTPDDNSEFTGEILNAFAANAGPGSPAEGLTDFYSFVNSEIYHALGLYLEPTRMQTPLKGTLTNTMVPDQAQGGGIGSYWVFDGPSITLLMTSNNGGPASLKGQDFKQAIHTAGPRAENYPIAFTSAYRGNVSLVGQLDAGNALDEGGRVLVPDTLVNLFKDAYGYSVQLPSTFPGGTFNINVNPTTRELTVIGGPGASDDRVRLRRVGNEVVVTVDPRQDGPLGGLDPDNDGDATPFVARVALQDFDRVRIATGAGNDNVEIDLTGGDFLPEGGFRIEGGAGTDEVHFTGVPTFNATSSALTLAGLGKIELAGEEQVTVDAGLSGTTTEGQPLLLDLTAPLAAPSGQALHVTSVAGALNGKVGDNGNGSLTYTPNPGFRGYDRFQVNLADGEGETLTAQVQVTVKPDLSSGLTASLYSAAVQAWYHAILGRDAEPAGLNFWAAALSAGATTRDVTAAIWNSAEHRTQQVVAFYQLFLGRTPDTAGQSFWVHGLQNGSSEATVVLGILQSTEYAQKEAEANAFVRGLYLQILGRAAGDAEVAGWRASLAGGATRAQVAAAFVASREASARIVDSFYARYLGRPADEVGRSFWLERVQSGAASLADVAFAFLGSEEFLSNATLGQSIPQPAL